MMETEESKVLVYEFDKSEDCMKAWDDIAKIGHHPAPYESIVTKEWYDNMGFCGCGNPEDVQYLLEKLLGAYKERSESSYKIDNINNIFEDNKDAVKLFMLYALDAMGLTEHGGSVYGSWLTENGKKMLQKLIDSPPPKED